MRDPDDPVYLAALTVGADDLAIRGHRFTVDRPDARLLRSVLMKPESELHLDWLVSRIDTAVGAAANT
jgi:hypothetical protein